MHGHPSHNLRSLGVRPRRSLSQSFLRDDRTAAAIVRAAHVTGEDVLEVGPGLGVLTQRLARAARRVVAIEIDEHLADALRDRLPIVEVVSADVLRVDLDALFEAEFVVVANLPYHITSPVLRQILASKARRAVVMVQKEVGDRIAAGPGGMSALSVIVQAQASAQAVLQVPRSAFFPRPNVDSVVLRLERLSEAERAIDGSDVPDFDNFVHAGFKQPRKQLANSIADGLGIQKADALALIARAELEPSRRPQELSIGDWVRLYRLAHTPEG